MSKYSILVVGAGSIGRRHTRLLLEQEQVQNVAVQDPNIERLLATKDELPQCSTFEHLIAALDDFRPDAVFICAPTALHTKIANEVLDHHPVPLFIEKPLSATIHEIPELMDLVESRGVFGVVGYTLRFHPAIRHLKTLVDSNAIGTPLYARASVGQHLSQWHPNEHYTTWYMGQRKMGGGALLDLSHEIDYMQWLFGPITQIQGGLVRQVALKDSDVDDLVEFTAEFRSGTIGTIHLDLIDQDYHRTCRIVGTEGSIDWDWVRGSVKYNGLELHHNLERDFPFEQEQKRFLEALGGDADALKQLVSLEDAYQTMKVIWAVRSRYDVRDFHMTGVPTR